MLSGAIQFTPGDLRQVEDTVEFDNSHWITECLGLTLVFEWIGALREEFN